MQFQYDAQGMIQICSILSPRKIFFNKEYKTLTGSHECDALQILGVDLWTQGPNLDDIGTFAVHVST